MVTIKRIIRKVRLIPFVILNVLQIMLLGIFRFAGRFVKNKPWVIHERGVDARDNGYWFYRYMKEKHPEQKVYYIIDRKSADYVKVQVDAVHLGSLLNYWVMAIAEKIVCTHIGMGLPKYFHPALYKKLGFLDRAYFLQHGVVKDDLPSLYGNRASVRLFVCGAKPEFEYIKNHFGHPEGVVQYTGLARFDKLHNISVKNQILVMPTWRAYHHHSKDEFLKSDFYVHWQSFLNHPGLLQKLEDANTKLIFYPHFETQKYLTSFSSGSPNVILASFADYDVQTLLKESAVLVTDYSSVYFDFAYMQKPVVFYQFDEEEFFSHHYAKGYFDYRIHGFGSVCVEESSAIAELTKIWDNSFKLDEFYAERVRKFFPLHDQNNCERIYQAILERKI